MTGPKRLTPEQVRAFDRPTSELTAAGFLRAVAKGIDSARGSDQIVALADRLEEHASAGQMNVGVAAPPPMTADFFGTLYVELEEAGDQGGWLERQGINGRAWIAFCDVLRRELNDGVAQGLDARAAIDATIAAALQVGWEAAKRTPAPVVPRPE